MKLALGLVLGCSMLVGCGEGLGHHGQYAKTPEVSTTELTSADVAAPAAKNSARPAVAADADAYNANPSASRQLHLLDRNDPYAAQPTPVNTKRWMADRNDPYTGEPVDTHRAKVDTSSPYAK